MRHSRRVGRSARKTHGAKKEKAPMVLLKTLSLKSFCLLLLSLLDLLLERV
jgi:hypothetical protein